MTYSHTQPPYEDSWQSNTDGPQPPTEDSKIQICESARRFTPRDIREPNDGYSDGSNPEFIEMDLAHRVYDDPANSKDAMDLGARLRLERAVAVADAASPSCQMIDGIVSHSVRRDEVDDLELAIETIEAIARHAATAVAAIRYAIPHLINNNNKGNPTA